MNGVQDVHSDSIAMELQNENINQKADNCFSSKMPFEEILCKADIFEMGHKGNALAPNHLVEIENDYLISSVLITQDVWKSINNDRIFQNGMGDQIPMQRINWFEAALFCNMLSRKANLPSCYEFSQGRLFFDGNKKGYRLPFEVEWENSARANTINEYSGSDKYEEVAHLSTKDNYLKPVKMKKPNAWGIYDMTGNVNEWCNDIYDESAYYKRMKEGKVSSFDVKNQHFEINLQNSSQTQMVVRGGSWFNTPGYSKVYTRHQQNILLPSAMVGVRVIRSV
jgi:formylglycine-generating enzyme required for sulfatase activity